MGTSLYIGDNALLTSLDGLRSLTDVGDLDVAGNDSLLDLNLPSLTSIDGDLRIVGNDALVSLDGLSTVMTVSGYLQVGSNASLTSPRPKMLNSVL